MALIYRLFTHRSRLTQVSFMHTTGRFCGSPSATGGLHFLFFSGWRSLWMAVLVGRVCFFTVCRIEQGRAEGLALEHGFLAIFADRMWDDRCVVMGFVEGFSCIFQA